MNISNKTIIWDIVAYDYKTASVFKKYGIDFCCNGNRSIEEACNDKDINNSKLIIELNEILHKLTDNSINYTIRPLDLLVDYIEKTHHRYVKNKIPEISAYLTKIVKVHGDRHPELIKIAKLFAESANDITTHMEEEETGIFPLIRKLIINWSDDQNNNISIGQIKLDIKSRMHEHDIEWERFREIAKLTNNYTPPSDSCNTYRVTFAMLQEYENDLHLHIHLENNILFPRSITSEN